MISHDFKCIYIHVPKCAGTSIEHALGHFDGHEGRGGQDHRSMRMIEPLSLHAFSPTNWQQVYRRYNQRPSLNPNNEITVTKEQFRKYYKFAIVRNPWARAYSWFLGVSRDPVMSQDCGVSCQESFTDYLRRFAGRGAMISQVEYLRSWDGGIHMDHVIRLEDIDAGWQQACRDLGIEKKLPHKNKSKNYDYLHAFDEESFRIISEAYSDDISMFGYSPPSLSSLSLNTA